MSTLELCEKYFDTRDVYKLFNVEKTAAEKDIKKAYYKMSLLVHPDRVPESQKETATEKFKLLSKLYQILVDKHKKALYDEHGIIDDDDDNAEARLGNWLELWKKLFKPISEQDINNYEKSYVGSDLEKTDIKKAYLSGRGCIDYMVDSIPFMKVEDEPRIQNIVREMIADGEVPEYKKFTQESENKRRKRHNKYAREERQAEKIKAKMDARNRSRATDASGSSSATENGSLEQAIMARQKSRESGFNTLMDKLMEKYGHEDDEKDVVDFNVSQKGKTKKKQQKKDLKEKVDSPLHGVRNGRVKK